MSGNIPLVKVRRLKQEWTNTQVEILHWRMDSNVCFCFDPNIYIHWWHRYNVQGKNRQQQLHFWFRNTDFLQWPFGETASVSMAILGWFGKSVGYLFKKARGCHVFVVSVFLIVVDVMAGYTTLRSRSILFSSGGTCHPMADPVAEASRLGGGLPMKNVHVGGWKIHGWSGVWLHFLKKTRDALEKAKRKPHFWIKTTGDHMARPVCVSAWLMHGWQLRGRDQSAMMFRYVYSCGFLCVGPFPFFNRNGIWSEHVIFAMQKKSGYQWISVDEVSTWWSWPVDVPLTHCDICDVWNRICQTEGIAWPSNWNCAVAGITIFQLSWSLDRRNQQVKMYVYMY